MRRLGGTFLLTFLLPYLLTSAFAFDSIHLQQTITAPAIKNFTPTGVALDAAGQVWVSDVKNNQLDLFSSSGTLIKRIGQEGKESAEFQEPHALALAPDGRLYVGDSGNARVQIFSAEGQWLASFGEKGSAAGQFSEPWSLAVSLDGTVIVSEKGSSRVQLFSADGIYLQQFDAGFAVDAIAVDPSGWIYTAHVKEHLLQSWSGAGQLHATVTGDEPGIKGLDKPVFLAVSRTGFLYVSDAGFRQFREMDLSGKTLGSFGRPGTGAGQFRTPAGIATLNDDLAIADARNRSVTVFHLEHAAVAAPTPVPVARLQITRRAVWPVAADALAVNPDGSLHALSASRLELMTWNLTANTTSVIDLKKTTPPFRNPSGITTAPSSGSIFVADATLDRAYKMDRQGKMLLEFGAKELSKPHGLVCSPKGVLLIADTGNSRFQAYNHQGLFQFSGGEKGSGVGQLRNPVTVAWDKDQIYVADPGNKKVVTFNTSGRFIRETGALGFDSLVDPRQVAVDREGHVFVLDSARGRIVVFDAEGLYLGGFGTEGQSAGFLNHAKAIALADNGDLYVAEAHRIQTFHVVLLPPAPKNVTAVPGEGFITLKWDAVQTRFPARYLIYRSSAGVSAAIIKETVDTSWTDEGLPPQTTFTYVIAAQSVLGATSVPSAAVSVAANPIISGPRIDISSVQINGVFSANYKFYSREPLAQVTLHNGSAAPAKNVKLSFMVQEYMDFPTEVILPELHANESRDIPLKATFNNKVLSVTETTPVQAELKASWYSGSAESSVIRHQPFTLYSRNTLRWDIKERLAAFITPNDPPVLDFARAVSIPFAQAHAGAPMPEPFATAWAVFSGLSAYGITYAPRPNNPYNRVSLDSSTVDTLQFPRETLARQSGDCADVVALLASALEAMTITTAALDAPGHLFLMFDTGESRLDVLALPEDRLVFYAGTWWVPLEATLLGEPFSAAWKKGADEYQQWSATHQVSPIDIHAAWGSFEPATLPDQPLDVKAPTRDAIEQKFLDDWKALPELRWKTAVAQAEKAGPYPILYREGPSPADTHAGDAATAPGSGAPWLQMGFIAVEFKRYPEAAHYFTKAKDDPLTAASALNNLGNLDYLQEDWDGAAADYQNASLKDPTDGRILINLARAQMKAGKKTAAKKSYDQAIGIDAKLKDEYPHVDAL